MRHLAMGMAALLLLGAPCAAQDSAKAKSPPAKTENQLSPAEQFKAVTSDYDKARAEFFTEYRKAKTDAERQKLVQTKYPNAGKAAQKCLDLAQKNPKEPFAIDALIWVLRHTSGSDAQAAATILLHDHLESPKMRDVAQFLSYSDMPKAEEYSRTLLEKNTNKEVKGIACFSLAQIYKRRAEAKETPESKREAMYKQAEQYCERIITDFADVKSYRPLGELAKSQLFELQHLRIGMPAPIIEGEDIDGKKFTLKDYRGKVVVLDFWGNW